MRLPCFTVIMQYITIQASVKKIGAGLGARWNLWIEDFEMFLLASGIATLNVNVHYCYVRQGIVFARYFDKYPIQEMPTSMKQRKTN